MKLFGSPDIEKMKAKKDVKGLVKALRYSKDPTVQSAAGTALVTVGDIRDSGAVESLLAALNDQDRDVREIAAVALHQVRDPRAVEPLIHVVKDSNQYWFLRWRAASRLGEIGDPRAVEPLIAVLRGRDQDDDNGADVRRHAAGALSRIGDPRAIEPLIAALKDPHALMRWEAGEALVRIGARAVEPLIAALKDQSEVQRWVIVGQPGSGKREVVMETVGRDAARALGSIGDPRAIEPLIAALKDSHAQVRQAARVALVGIGAPSVEPLIAALNDPEQEVREAVAKALVSIYQSRKLDQSQKARVLTQRSAITEAGFDFPT
jgi:HEAT repeat protein